MKTLDISEIIAACDLEIIEIMNIVSIEGQGHFITI